MDFYKISERYFKTNQVEIYPDFRVCRSKDLMVRGKSFYAIWDEKAGLWSTDEYDVARLIDDELKEYYETNKDRWIGYKVSVKWMSNYSSKAWVEFKNYISKVSDVAKQLDTKICFSNMDVEKKDYISRKLEYPLKKGKCPAYNEIMSTLYSKEERQKIEWAIGAIINGDSKRIQKFIVLYGEPGTGKSTVLDIIQQLFKGYYTVFEAKALTSSRNVFATEAFKANPLIAIQHDGDLSRIEDNSTLNSIISHEEIMINEKYKSAYAMKVNCFLFMATNKPVKITDAKAGLIRRLIDVRPTGNKLEADRYFELKDQVQFELGAIAQHCLEVYESMGKDYYNKYRPVDMMFKTDPFFNFVEDHFDDICRFENEQGGISLKQAYTMYKDYCQESNADYILQMYKFREELKDYFDKFYDSYYDPDIDLRVRSFYKGFRKKKFERAMEEVTLKPNKKHWIDLKAQDSLFDEECADILAQLAVETESGSRPEKKWSDATTTLKDIDTHKLHFVKLPKEHIVVDFDISENGEKSLRKNLEAASKFPKTYAEVSKSGKGLHLHYLYSGDVDSLSRVYDDNIEVKVFTGNSSLRRKLTLCNDIPIATIDSGLPLKEKKGGKMVDFEAAKSERGLRALIEKNLNKEVHNATKPSIDFITKILDDAYASGLHYDVTDLRNKVLIFAMHSTNQADYCIKAVNQMKFRSEEPSATSFKKEAPIVIFDCEVFPNLFLINWKMLGEKNKCVHMINPTPNEIEQLLKYRLVGFNNRRYDNHLLYARLQGYSNQQLFKLSQNIIDPSKHGSPSQPFFSQAYDLSYTDILDFSSKKQGLKKWEIELGIHHLELGLPWDQPVPESKWQEVSDYCDNDVISTEAVWNHLQGDFMARQILADLAGGTVNDTTNALTTKIIFGKNRRPQTEFFYRNLADPVMDIPTEGYEFLSKVFPDMMKKTHGDKKSLLPYFEGYLYSFGKSSYKNEDDVGEGGRVWAKPGLYGRTLVFDVTSMHPHSCMAEWHFGPYTEKLCDLVYGRVYIKHEDWNAINDILDGKLSPYVEKIKNGEISSKDLAYALKIAINSVYGLTAAKFENPFRDPRNKDNIVAKRGALFMIDLQEEVEKRGGKVIHIKTDSIKIVEPSDDICKFVIEFGKRYGYTFEIEHIFEKICLVNDAVYIAKLATDDPDWIGDCKKAKEKGNPEPTRWTATGTQFAVPYVFKTLFSHEEIGFEDKCETKAVTTALYLDMNEKLPDVSLEEKEKDIRDWNERIKGNKEKKPKKNLPEFVDISDEELQKRIDAGHSYHFVGRVGRFCPVNEGSNGGRLMTLKDDKYNSANGTKGFRWLESEVVKSLNLEEEIDTSYYISLVDKAVEAIKEVAADSEYGDVDWFIS